MRKLSRRGVFTATVAAVAAVGQQPSPTATPTTKDEDLASARSAIQNSSAALAKVKVPIATEPAFAFKA